MSAAAPRPPSRPTTPLRASSRTSLRATRSPTSNPSAHYPSPLSSLEPAFAELADSMADLEANMMHLQLMHESLSRFGENFAAFLYGLNVNAFCVDFPEAPNEESWSREENRRQLEEEVDGSAEGVGRGGTAAAAAVGGGGGGGFDPENTFMTTDTSFVEHPPLSSRSGSRFATPAGKRAANQAPRGGTAAARGGGVGGSGAPGGSGIARGIPRGASSSALGGIGRGMGRATGANATMGRGAGTNVAAGGRGGPTVRGTRASGLARASAAAKGRGR